jgi:hypothetical protein
MMHAVIEALGRSEFMRTDTLDSDIGLAVEGRRLDRELGDVEVLPPLWLVGRENNIFSRAWIVRGARTFGTAGPPDRLLDHFAQPRVIATFRVTDTVTRKFPTSRARETSLKT